jgi:Pyruvate/2-oxoacid:ferredoxin oxidoreductase delta subunit
METSKKIVLKFPRTLANKPIVYRLTKEYNLEFNILKASITPSEEGLIGMELVGEEEDHRRGMDYLLTSGVQVQPLSKDIIWKEDRCTQCGACTVLCPSDALAMDRSTMKVSFDSGRCVACELCVMPCPPRAIEVHF